MSWQQPLPSEVWRAVEIYLGLAYDGPPPPAVRARLATLRSAPESEFFSRAVFERSPEAAPTRYSLRLGNRSYPHMKLVIDRSPDGRGYLLRADTHDGHVQPAPGSSEQAAFRELTEKNRALADAIEAAWDEQNLPTFKRFLRNDLARRKAAKG